MLYAAATHYLALCVGACIGFVFGAMIAVSKDKP